MLQAKNASSKRRFPASRLANNGQSLPLPDIERNAVDSTDDSTVRGKLNVNVFELQHAQMRSPRMLWLQKSRLPSLIKKSSGSTVNKFVTRGDFRTLTWSPDRI